MNSRLIALIEYRTEGSRSQFAELMGWSRPYLSKLLRGESIGLAPVCTILATFPDIDARWLLLGEGEMIRR
jgi:transcriptional regulator with XRE-family HTH domain